MKVLKNIILTVLGVIGVCILSYILTGLALIGVLYLASGHIGVVDAPIGYYDKQEYFDKDGFQDYTDYCKYYYTEKDDIKFSENEDYRYIGGKEDISEVVNYFEDFEVWMLPERADEYDFNKSQITIGDYVYIYDKEGEPIGQSTYEKFKYYDVYFYDVETHILYYIHNNI